MCCKRNRVNDWWTVDGDRTLSDLMDRIHEVHVVEWGNSSRIYVVREAPYKVSSNNQTWLVVAWDLDWHVEISWNAGEARMGSGETKAPQRSKTEASTLSILKMKKSFKRPLKMQEVRSSYGSCYALQDGDKKACLEVTGNCSKWEYSSSQKNKMCLHCGSSWIHKETSGIYPSEKSRGSHRRDKGSFLGAEDRFHTVHNTERKNILTDTCGPGSGFQKFKQSPDLIIRGPKFGPGCQKQLNERKSSNGLSRNRSSTVQECWEAFILLIWTR